MRDLSLHEPIPPHDVRAGRAWNDADGPVHGRILSCYDHSVQCKPFVKWAGGKTRLLPSILPLVPMRIGTYCEPFAGGAALFFALASESPRRFKRAILSDANEDLIDCYRAIKHDVGSVIRALRKHKSTSKAFYKARATDPATLSASARAARFIFLNKTCFNGLYRVNKKGLFNTPFGRYKNPCICDTEVLHAASAALKCVRLVAGDFTKATRELGSGDFVYFDPPYIPLSSTADFTSYTKDGFGALDQKRLAREMERLRKKGVRTLLSNADARGARALYKTFQRRHVMAARAINCDGRKRGPVRELLLVG
jgi:DNA adenine methylase